MSSCPSTSTLALLGTDSFREGTLAAIEAHVEGCHHCQDELDRLVRNDLEAGPGLPSLPDPDAAPRIPGFVIECELGRGGMGVVYRAFQPSLDRRVALKVVRSGPGAGSRDHARWLREARAFSCVRHPNVVPLFEVNEANGWLYLVLELIPGGTLERRLVTPYAPHDAARFLLAVAEAVVAIHREGLVHLDLKPSNILLDGPPDAPREQAVPRVADFGIAWRWSDPEATLATASLAGPVGTPSYMAPEQVMGDRSHIGPAADIYGLGALLYHLLTGHRPFAAAQVIETLDQVRSREPVPPRRLNPAIPRDLETICLKCLRKEPGQRYDSASSAADDLRRFLDGRAIAAHPASPLEKTWRLCRRRPAVAALTAALAFTMSAGFLGMFALWRHAEAQRRHAEFQRTRAEEAQTHSEADFKLATEVLGQLVELSAGGQSNLPRMDSSDQVIHLLQTTRWRLVDLATRRPDRRMIFRQLTSLENRLCDALSEQGRWNDARSMLDESLRESERLLLKDPRARWARPWQHHHLFRLAILAHQQGKFEESERLYRRAIDQAERWSGPGHEDIAIVTAVEDRRNLARLLSCRGRHEEIRTLLLANLREVDAVPRELVDEHVLALRVMTHLDFSHFRAGDPPRPRPGGPVADDPLTRLASPDGDRLPPDDWADLALRALNYPGRPDRGLARELSAGFRFAHLFLATAADQRRWGRLDLAGRTADRMLALARLLVERNPENPDSHLLLADAYQQVNKNAWQTGDRAAIVPYLERAIAENQRALILDPESAEARHAMERRQRRLKDLLAPHSEAPAPTRPGSDASRGL